MDQQGPPKFANDFLGDVYGEITKRLRSLKQGGATYFEFDEGSPVHWFNFHCHSKIRPSIILTLSSNHLATITIRSVRGKNIFSIRDLALVGNAGSIVRALEWTKANLSDLRNQPPTQIICQKLLDRWRSTSLRIFDKERETGT